MHPFEAKLSSGEELQELISAYNSDLASKFDPENLGEDAKDPAKIAEKVRLEMLTSTGAFISGIAHLARHADSEAIRLNACKYGLDYVTKLSAAEGVQSDLDKLLNSLTSQRPVGDPGTPGHSPHED